MNAGMWNAPLHPALTVAGPSRVGLMPVVGAQPLTGFTLPQQQQQQQQTPGGSLPPGPGSQALMMYQPQPRIQTMGASSRMGSAGGGAPVGSASGPGASRGSRCQFCNEMISGDQYIRTDIMVCHSDCFRCSICCTGMNGTRAFRLGSRICCQQCFRTLTVCAYCGGPIINGKSWVEFNQLAYHPNHLFCTAPGCGVALRFESGYALTDTDHRLPVCPAHHPNAVACAVCGCLVVGEGIQLSDRGQLTLRHPECFMCSFCGFLLSWDFIIDQYGRPLCSDHIDMVRSFQQLESKSKPKVYWQDLEESISDEEEEVKVKPVPDSWVDRRGGRASSLYSKVDTRSGRVVAKRRFSKVERRSGMIYRRPSDVRFSKIDGRRSMAESRARRRGSQVDEPFSKLERRILHSFGPDGARRIRQSSGPDGARRGRQSPGPDRARRGRQSPGPNRARRGRQSPGPDRARRGRQSSGPAKRPRRAKRPRNTVRRPKKGILKPSRLNNASNLSASKDDSHGSFHLSVSRSNCEAADTWETEALSEEEVAHDSDWEEQKARNQHAVARTFVDQSPSAIPASSSSSSRSSSWATTGSSAAASVLSSHRSHSCQRTLNAASIESPRCRSQAAAAVPQRPCQLTPAAVASSGGELSPTEASQLAKSDSLS